jgi:cell division protease FtsH
MIDSEIRRLVDGGEAKAREVLKKRIKDLHALAAALLEYETLSSEEVHKVLKGEPIVRKDGDDAPTAPASSAVPVTKKPRGGATGAGDMEPQPST